MAGGRKREDDYNLSVSTYVEAEDNGTITKQLVSQSQHADDRGDRGGVCECVIKGETMKRTLYLILTIVVMLIVSRFAVRIVDATVQIDGNMIALSLFLLTLNMLIGIVSYRLYRRIYAGGGERTEHETD